MDPVQRLREDYHSSHLRITNGSDLEGIIIPGLICSLARVVPVREDESGFRAFCIHSHIGWIKVRFIRRFVFAHQRRAQDELVWGSKGRRLCHPCRRRVHGRPLVM